MINDRCNVFCLLKINCFYLKNDKSLCVFVKVKASCEGKTLKKKTDNRQLSISPLGVVLDAKWRR